MKKIVVFASVILVSACSALTGFWKEKEVWTQNLAAYHINYFNSEPQLIRSENFTERNNKTNQILTAYKGQSVVYSKIYAKEVYATESVRINHDGALNNSAAPINFKKGDTRQVIGTSYVDGADYYLVPSDLQNYVFLVRDNGTFYKKMGQIRNNMLVIMATDYVPYPDDLRFEPVMGSASEQTRPIDGYEIRYEGIKKGRMQFTYMTFGASGKAGTFDTIEYQPRTGVISIRGNKVNVVNVNDDKLDYTILE